QMRSPSDTSDSVPVPLRVEQPVQLAASFLLASRFWARIAGAASQRLCRDSHARTVEASRGSRAPTRLDWKQHQGWGSQTIQSGDCDKSKLRVPYSTSRSSLLCL